MAATAQQLEFLKNSIKSIHDYPEPGIFFHDVTSLLEDPKAYTLSIELLVERYKNAGITKAVGTEARGSLSDAPVALGLGVDLVLVCKPRKLPREVIAEAYELEYGIDRLEIHVDTIKPGDKVLVVDDLLATGDMIEATVKLVHRLGGGVTDAVFIISLFDLGSEQRLERQGLTCYSLVPFPGRQFRAIFFAILAPVSARNPYVLRVRSGFCALPETKPTATITPGYNVSTSPSLRGCVSIISL